MIPSRGLRWSSQTIGTCRRRIEPIPTRKFSSFVQYKPFQPSPLLSTTSASFSKTVSKASFRRPNNTIRNAGGIRFASTTPAATTAAANPLSPSDAVSSSAAPAADTVPESSYDYVPELLPDSIYNIPEHIGYLKSLGLDYGWGPTSMMEWTLEHIHIYAGTPWWISIGLTAILVRVILFQPYVGAADNAARLATVKHITDPVTTRMKDAQKRGDVDSVMRLRQDLGLIHKRAGIKLWRSFVPALQGVTGYGTFIILRAMSKLPVPGLETGGILWFSNLAIPDPLYLLPLATAGILHWVLRKGGETGVTTVAPEVMKAMMYGFPLLTFVFTAFFPAAAQLSFLVSGVLSWGQSSLFKMEWFRKALNMTPLPTTTGPPPAYKGTIRMASTPSPSPSSPGNPSRYKPVLSTSELNSRFQPTSPSKPIDHQPPVSASTSFLSKITKPISEVADAGRGIMKKGNDSMSDRRKKAELEEKQRYEAKRQLEQKRQKWDRENERRQERARRNEL